LKNTLEPALIEHGTANATNFKQIPCRYHNVVQLERGWLGMHIHLLLA